MIQLSNSPSLYKNAKQAQLRKGKALKDFDRGLIIGTWMTGALVTKTGNSIAMPTAL